MYPSTLTFTPSLFTWLPFVLFKVHCADTLYISTHLNGYRQSAKAASSHFVFLFNNCDCCKYSMSIYSSLYVLFAQNGSIYFQHPALTDSVNNTCRAIDISFNQTPTELNVSNSRYHRIHAFTAAPFVCASEYYVLRFCWASQKEISGSHVMIFQYRKTSASVSLRMNYNSWIHSCCCFSMGFWCSRLISWYTIKWEQSVFPFNQPQNGPGAELRANSTRTRCQESFSGRRTDYPSQVSCRV